MTRFNIKETLIVHRFRKQKVNRYICLKSKMFHVLNYVFILLVRTFVVLLGFILRRLYHYAYGIFIARSLQGGSRWRKGGSRKGRLQWLSCLQLAPVLQDILVQFWLIMHQNILLRPLKITVKSFIRFFKNTVRF